MYMNIKVEFNLLCVLGSQYEKSLVAKKKITISPMTLIWLFERQRCKILNRCTLWLGSICDFAYEGVNCLVCLSKDYFSDQLNPS